METFSGTFRFDQEKHHVIRHDFFLAFLIFTGVLVTFGLFMSRNNAAPVMNAHRYGKEVLLKANSFMELSVSAAIKDENKVVVYWKVENQAEKGVFAVMRSADGVNFTYVHMQAAVPDHKEGGHFTFSDENGTYASYYKILFIANDNTFVESGKIAVTNSFPEFKMMRSESLK